MSKKLNPDSLYRACRMAFQGDTFAKIGHEFDVHPETIRNWSRREEWRTFTEELTEAAKERELAAFSMEAQQQNGT